MKNKLILYKTTKIRSRLFFYFLTLLHLGTLKLQFRFISSNSKLSHFDLIVTLLLLLFWIALFCLLVDKDFKPSNHNLQITFN